MLEDIMQWEIQEERWWKIPPEERPMEAENYVRESDEGGRKTPMSEVGFYAVAAYLFCCGKILRRTNLNEGKFA